MASNEDIEIRRKMWVEDILEVIIESKDPSILAPHIANTILDLELQLEAMEELNDIYLQRYNNLEKLVNEDFGYFVFQALDPNQKQGMNTWTKMHLFKKPR